MTPPTTGSAPSVPPVNRCNTLNVLAAQAPGANTRATAMTAKIAPTMNQDFFGRMELPSSAAMLLQWNLKNECSRRSATDAQVWAAWPREELDSRACLPSEKEK